MTALTAPLIALLAAKLFWPFIARERTVRLVFLTVFFAIMYWYWAPAVNILTIGYMGQDRFVPDRIVAEGAVWTVLVYQLAAMAALGCLGLFIPERPARTAYVQLPAGMLGMLALCGAAAFLVWNVAGWSTESLTQLMAGRTSAREFMDFYNFSSGIQQSMRALLEVSTVFIALVVLAHATLKRQLGNVSSLSALAAVTLMLVATGTRAPLLMMIFVVVLCQASGQRVRRQTADKARAGMVVVAASVASIPIILALTARAASTGMTNMVLSMLVVNNDMFRELVFVESHMTSYRGADAMAFMLTPFTYTLPTFLGFARHIPEHLLVFNHTRANIDLILGSGNVFPGLIADNVLVFGIVGPLWFGIFIGAFAAALRGLGQVVPPGPARSSVQAAAAAFLFVSFRNLHPGLGLVLGGAALGLWAWRVLGSSRAMVAGHANRA